MLMSRKRPRTPTERKEMPTPGISIPWGYALLAVAAALVIGFILYSPARNAPFFFDDNALNIRLGERDEPVSSALMTRRPVLSTSYWLDYQANGDSPSGYRDINLIIHALNVALVFLVLFHLLELAGWSLPKQRIAALLGAAVFLVHPLQTESVAYIAGRSESLCAFFMLLAWVVFLYRPEGGISWLRAAAVLLLAGLAMGAKENAVAIGGVLLLTDFFWGREGGWKAIRENRRLYLPAAALGLVAAVGVWRILAQAQTAGSATGIRWYQYGLTEARAIFTYLRMEILPYGQSVDHDFAVSRTPFESGAIFYVLAIAGLVALAWLARRRFALASFGLLLFLILLAPTSSIVPIADPLVERRIYLPLLGLILVAAEAMGRWRMTQAAAAGIAAVLAIFAVVTYQRNMLWGNPEQMWIATAARSTHKSRPYLHLSELLETQHRCPEAMPYLERAERLMPDDGMVQVGIARIQECLGHRDEALARLRRTADTKPSTGVFQWLGLLEGAMGRSPEAGAALRKAVQLGPLNSEAHSALGLWYESVGDRTAAIAEYKRTVELNQYNPEARTGLLRLTGKSR
jgi:tetratricopeptide (TPR) repeat protein